MEGGDKNTDGDQKILYRVFISISPSLESFSGVEWVCCFDLLLFLFGFF